MRKIERTKAFKRDYQRESAGQLGSKLDGLLTAAVSALVEDKRLPVANRDHPLSGQWNDCRECHLKGDLLLIYRKPDKDTLQLVRLGSHSELFG
jgi:mRNA interferase YafQ